MSINKRLHELGFKVVARTSAEPSTKFEKGIIPLYPHERLSVDVNAALNKAQYFELQCDWDKQLAANYMYIVPRSPAVLDICKRNRFGYMDVSHQPDHIEDLYSAGLTLQLDIGYDDADWEDANSNVVKYDDALSMTHIPVAWHLDGKRLAVAYLRKIDDLPEWVEQTIRMVDIALYRKLKELTGE